MLDKIEILSLDLFKSHNEEMEIVKRMQKYFKQGIGWHYYLDLAWMIREVKKLPRGSLILDAGAGTGLAQFILAELGYNVISADFTTRIFSRRHIKRYKKVIYRLNDQEQTFDNRYIRHLQRNYNIPIARLKRGIINKILQPLLLCGGIKQEGDAVSIIEKNRYHPKGNGYNEILKSSVPENCGRIFICKCDLKDMVFLPDNFVDGIVSISALEHNDHEDFEKCMEEILRVTKPGGRLSITVSASQSDDWFHESSKGWCYSETSLKKLFKLSEDVPSNFSQKDELFKKLKEENNELHKRLAPFYYKSGSNGMPWGKWDPRYQPVGVVEVKHI